MSQISVDSVIPQSGTTITIGGSGDTVTLGSGASQSGFGSAAYAANASASTGAVNIDASDNFQFDSGYGSTATAYGCRAWVNFNGTGTVAIRGSGNVSSITDNGTGNYTVNFTTAMTDSNYSVATSGDSTLYNSAVHQVKVDNPTTSTFLIRAKERRGGLADISNMYAIVVR